ncbi:yippee zinc-binding/DNA-binding /Mis18, centromere assembly-domain-containing protein [Cladochytrium replicatum]|nr:yippee zinc-binding/DNA-binding /Mis18, centromere assembly-domain-containing protein [Cladochytrium replicatum]
MGIVYRIYLDGSEKVYGCATCKTHLSDVSSLISDTFRGHHGPAWLFDKAVNILEGKTEEREMMTGKHIVRDISCISCSTVLGWKYERAYVEAEKYKEGKFILESKLLTEIPTRASMSPPLN